VLVLPLALQTICLDLGCTPKRSTTESEPARPVKTLLVSPANKPTVRSFPGKVEASKKVDLAFQVPGLVVKQPGKEGKAVAKGDMICQTCQKTFCSNTATPYYRLQHRRATFDQVATLSVEGLNKSAIARVAHIGWNTVDRWLEKLATAAVVSTIKK
jgi:hypothetical protein